MDGRSSDTAHCPGLAGKVPDLGLRQYGRAIRAGFTPDLNAEFTALSSGFGVREFINENGGGPGVQAAEGAQTKTIRRADT